MPTPVHNRENRDGAGLNAEEDSKGEATNLRPTNVVHPQRVESGIGAYATPAGLDLGKKLQTEPASLEFIPEKLRLELELGAPADS